MTYRYEFDWFSDHIELFAEQLAGDVGKPRLRYVEIGSFEGRSAVWLLENVLTHPTSRLHCIDPWQYPRKEIEERFDANVALALARSGHVERLTKHRALSVDILPTLEAGSIDAVYVDGSHTAWDTLTDLVLSWRLLRVGGLMICDDYPLESTLEYSDDGEAEFPTVPPLERPKMAIDAFLQCFEGRYRLRHKDWQVWLEKKTP
ncbi:MAG: class I SAM-dependent methyltransferase [Acidobacteriota bacterium]